MYSSILFISLILIETFSDLSLYYRFQEKYKQYNNLLFSIGLLFYLVMGIIYYYILKYYNDLAVPNAIYQALTVIAMTFVSYFIVKEKFNYKKILGISFVLFGLIILYNY